MPPKLVTIEDLFNAIKKKSKKEREKKKNFDGHKFWQGLKPILGNSLYKAKAWKKPRTTVFNATIKLTEYTIDGTGNKQIVEKNHFAIQTVRIPTIEQPTLRKIMQVALNIGQFEGYDKWDNYIDAGSISSPNDKFENYISKKEGDKKLIGILAAADIATLKTLLS